MAATLSYSDKQAPIAILAANQLCKVPLTLNADKELAKDADPVLSFPDGAELRGAPAILRYIARASQNGGSLLGDSPLASCQVDTWVEFATSQLVSGAGLEAACSSVNDYLSFRTLLVGYELTLADVAAWGQLQNATMWEKLQKSGKFPHLSRWYEFCTTFGDLKQIADTYGFRRPVPAAAAGGKKVKETGSFDIGLKDAKMGAVVTRFPPEPSGYLHIGHAKAALLNQYIASMYDGKLLVRFDDTNPTKEKDEYVESIVADIKRLGLKFEKISYTSDYFPQLFECAEKLILKGHMYADNTPLEQMRDERMKGIANKNRTQPVEETLRCWKEMLAGSEEGRTCCMRMKLDIAAGNTALRDPVAFRCNDAHHWRTGDKYKCYPTYDFACPFVDAIEGVTHALRTSEYKDREAQFYWILKLQQEVWPSLPNVHIWEYARLAFVNTVLSKRKLTWFVENGIVESWNDPRMPTVQGMLRRGLQIEALKEFIISQGASKNVTYQEWDKIWTMNKKVIDPVCPRHTAVEVQDMVPITLEDGPASDEIVDVPRHLKNPDAGTKQQVRSRQLWLDQADAAIIEDGEEVTLMAWGNVIMKKVHKDGSGKVTGIDAVLHLEGDFRKTRLKLTWLAQKKECPKLELQYFGNLLNKRKLEDGDDFEEFVNRDTKTVVHAVGDHNLRLAKQGEIVQLERKGYFIIDVPFESDDKPLIMFNIPDGRAKTMPGN